MTQHHGLISFNHWFFHEHFSERAETYRHSFKTILLMHWFVLSILWQSPVLPICRRAKQITATDGIDGPRRYGDQTLEASGRWYNLGRISSKWEGSLQISQLVRPVFVLWMLLTWVENWLTKLHHKGELCWASYLKRPILLFGKVMTLAYFANYLQQHSN